MREFFSARHVAVFGVSTRPGNLGARIVQNLLKFGYPGRVSPIGRGGGELAGLPIVPTLRDAGDGVDLAVILTPAATVPGIFAECAAGGVKRLIVESGGFAELGERGAALQAELKELARRHGLRFIGPNGIGLVDNHSGLAVPFTAMPRPPQGPVSVLAQSGGVGLLYASQFLAEGIGLAKFVSLGNKIDVDETDLLPFLAADDSTGIVMAYLESIADGRALCAAIRACPKPVLVHKANIGEASRAIAGSHTAALANDDAVVDAALAQAGARRTSNLGDTVAKVKAFLLPPMKGDRTVVVSRSGGHAIIAADECGKAGLVFPELPAEFLELVRRAVRADVIRLGNPLDVGDLYEMDAFVTIMEGVMALPEIDGVIFLFMMLSNYNPRVPERLVDRARELCRQHDKPLALVLYTYPEELARLKAYSDFPIFTSAEEAVAALAAGRDWRRAQQRKPRAMPRPRPNAAAAALLAAAPPGGWLPAEQAFALLDTCGIAHPPVAFAATAAAAVAAYRRLGGRVALKLESPDVVHKSEVGGVRLDLGSAREVRAAFAQLRENLAARQPGARFTGALLMPMAPPGLELIGGVKFDPSFGPVLLLGWGGVAAEAMEKVSLRLAPITRSEALEMIAELPGQKLLAGFRGRPGIRRGALADLLVRLGRLAWTPGLGEADLNPIVAGPDGVLALDARFRKRAT
ncbi:MAG: hypothetical protein GX444_19980 [Myxococcales bacterium]|nr:hypothetical protein [Myxococcales bacterium]